MIGKRTYCYEDACDLVLGLHLPSTIGNYNIRAYPISIIGDSYIIGPIEDYRECSEKEAICRCNNCWAHYAYDDSLFESDLALFIEYTRYGAELFRGCGRCRTDEFLMNIEEE